MSAEYGRLRIERLRQGMRRQGIDALLCLKPQSSFYLSGFNPLAYSHPVVAIVPLEGEPALLVHALRDDHARQSSWVQDVRLFGAWSTKKTMGLDWLAALRAILEERGVARGTLGFDGDFLPVATLRQMEQRLPEARFQDASELMIGSRMVKDAEEIAQMRIAARLADVGMDAALEAAAARKSEREIAVRAMAAMNMEYLERYPDIEVAGFGNLETSVFNGLWCHALTGDRIWVNLDNPTLRVPVDGEVAVIVIWATCNGMIAENERAVAFGRLDAEKRRAYEAVLEARSVSQTAIKPGVTCAEVFRASAGVFERLGYGRHLPGRIGHGMGLGGHELPSLGPADDVPLRPGMIFAFEPGLRVPEHGVGLQHSDTLVVNETGFEFLTQTQRGFIQV